MDSKVEAMTETVPRLHVRMVVMTPKHHVKVAKVVMIPRHHVKEAKVVMTHKHHVKMAMKEIHRVLRSRIIRVPKTIQLLVKPQVTLSM